MNLICNITILNNIHWFSISMLNRENNGFIVNTVHFLIFFDNFPLNVSLYILWDYRTIGNVYYSPWRLKKPASLKGPALPIMIWPALWTESSLVKKGILFLSILILARNVTMSGWQFRRRWIPIRKNNLS